MALDICVSRLDGSGRELLDYGTPGFPVACFNDNLGESAVPWHWHEELEAVYVAEGTALVTAGEEKFTVAAGQGFFISSGVLHGCRSSDGSDCRLHSLVFGAELVGGSGDSVFYEKYILPLLANPAASSVKLLPEKPWQQDALCCIEGAFQAFRGENALYELEVREALSRLVALLRINLPSDRQGKAKNRRQEQRMKEMLGFINDNLGERISVAEIAASANISESECMRCFRAAIGASPVSHLIACRINRAASLLASGEDKISVIAQSCGFDDSSYFGKMFRRAKGMTPSEYRARSRNASGK